jgi:predicted DNA binding CopG/RHH family protein
MKHIKLYEEFINESRSIEKIEKDRTRVINSMAEMVTNWKAAKASGDKEAETSFLQRLKDLTVEKNKFEQELNTAVAGKDRFIELVISENNTIFEGAMSEIDLLAREAKNFKDFVKEFKKDNADIANTGSIKELLKWLKSVYDSVVYEEVVSEKKGMYKITKNTEVEDSKIGNKFYNVKKGEKVELIDDDGDIATVKLRSGEIVNIESQFVHESDVNEGEGISKSIHDHWFDLYGEKFINEYPKVAKILKNRPNIDRRELARIWDEVYGEDFKKEYPGMWDRMDEYEVR